MAKAIFPTSSLRLPLEGFSSKSFLRVAHQKIKIEASKDVEFRMNLSFVHWFEVFPRYLEKFILKKMESPKVGNLPPELLVWARVSLKMLWVWPQPKRLPRDSAQALYGGVLVGECSLECGLGELPLPLWFCG